MADENDAQVEAVMALDDATTKLIAVAQQIRNTSDRLNSAKMQYPAPLYSDLNQALRARELALKTLGTDLSDPT